MTYGASVSDDNPLAAFGYETTGETILAPTGWQVGEGKTSETLQPAVILWVRVDIGTLPLSAVVGRERLGLGMPPDQADRLAEDLVAMARRAREKHWEQPGDEPPAP